MMKFIDKNILHTILLLLFAMSIILVGIFTNSFTSFAGSSDGPDSGEAQGMNAISIGQYDTQTGGWSGGSYDCGNDGQRGEGGGEGKPIPIIAEHWVERLDDAAKIVQSYLQQESSNKE